MGEEHERRRVELPGPSDATNTVSPAPSAARKPADFKSAHFEIHTDLPAREAHRLLRRMETMLRLISKYWDRPPEGIIECYVVDDLANWPADSLDPVGRAKIAQDAGITLVETLNQGRRVVSAKAVVYATAARGTPQHEAVHAYCGQTFGRVGPLWYSEGMAELGTYWRPNDSSVRCPDYVIEFLRKSRPKPLRAILGEDLDRPGRPATATGDSWQNYAWRWALCHLLENNANYAERFRTLGLGYLNDQPVRFNDAFGAMRRELAFEYRFFVTNVCTGFRVDLCRWNWNRSFKEADDAPIASRIAARRGWQPSGAIVSADQVYDYRATGTWRTAEEASHVSAAGNDDGTGRLEAVVLHDFRLSQPFALGASGSFRPPHNGRLYLRCRDAWNALADNRGSMAVRIQSAANPPSPRPSDAVDNPGDPNRQ